MEEKKIRKAGSKWIRQNKRLAIYLRDGLACAWCGRTLEDGAELSLDHIHPYSKGGSNGAANLITSCSHCNSVRGNRSYEEFAADCAGYLDCNSKQIIDYINFHAAMSLKPHMKEANSIIERRGSYGKAMQAIRNNEQEK